MGNDGYVRILNRNNGMMRSDCVGTFERWGMMGMCEFSIWDDEE